MPSLLLWSAIIVVANLFVTIADLAPGIRVALHPYTLEFIIGALIAIYFFKDNVPKLSAQSATLIIASTLLVGFPAIYSFSLIEQANLISVSFIGLMYGLIVLSATTLEKSNQSTAPRFLQFIGGISYTVYLSHLIVLFVIGRLWLLFTPAPNSLLDNLLAWIIMMTAVVCFGWVGYRLVEQPVLNISHRLRIRWFDSDRSNTLL